MTVTVWYLIALCLMLLMLVMRWLMRRGTSPLNRQVVRQLFVERLTAIFPQGHVLYEDDEHVTLQCGEVRCTCYLTTIYRRCLEDPFRMVLFVREAVEAVQAALQESDRLPEDWADRVVPLLLHTEYPTPPDLVVRPLLGPLVVGYALACDGAFGWITRPRLAASAVTDEALHATALRNLVRSCSQLVIDAPPPLPDGRDRLLRFRTNDGLDAARLLLPDFYQRYSPRFGDVDLVVAIPTRDLLLLIPATDQAQASFLSWRIDAERRRSPRPLSAQLLVVGEAGISPWYSRAMVEAE